MFRKTFIAALTAAAISATVNAQGIALTDAPFVTESSIAVKSNLYFVLDNSGSMNWDYLPDWMVDGSWCKGSAGTASLRCCRTPGGDYISSSSVSSTCLPQNSSGANLDGNGDTNLRGMPLFHAADVNAIYYNPTITYAPPKNGDGTEKTSYDGTGNTPWDGYGVQYGTGSTIALTSNFPDVEWCNGSSTTDCLRNDNYLLPGTVNGKSYTTMRAAFASGTKDMATGTPALPAIESRALGPFYYVIVSGEYCSTKKLTDCIASNQPTATHPFPAKIRWCNNSAGRVSGEPGASSSNKCQALKNATYQYARYPTLSLGGGTTGAGAEGKITISGLADSGNTTGVNATCNAVGAYNKVTVTSIRLNGDEILTAPFTYCNGSNTQSTRNNGLADAIRSRIGNGFSATRSNAVLTITAPEGTGYNGAVLGTTTSGDAISLSITTSFKDGVDASAGTVVPGAFKRIDIVSGQGYGPLYVETATGVVGSAGGAGTQQVLDRSTRTDCSGGVCTYAQELKNFANWFAWYRSRMQMMKSATGLAFQTIDDKVRIGYFTINNPNMNPGATTWPKNGLNIKDFTTGHKDDWYIRLYSANPDGGTALREALSRAGRLYAGQTSAITNAKDPVQYSCQRNFTLLSSDGYWNGNAGVNLSDSSISSDEDGDGRSATLADVASYFYETDLRASGASCTNSNNLESVTYSGLCTDDVPPQGDNDNDKQHMVTHTLGLGVDGVMQYRSNYRDIPNPADLPDDYYTVAAGTTANPGAGVCSWQSTGACKWPVPGSDKQENIDDMWHAAENAKGTYYSASNPAQLRSNLEDMLLKISAATGGAAAATTSNPNITTGDNFVFSSSFRTVEWYGELVRQQINPTSGEIEPGIDWSFQEKMDAAGLRNTVWTWDDTAGAKLFSYNNLNSADDTVCAPPVNEKGCFNSPRINGWAQWGSLTADQRTDAAGTKLVNFLRGDQSDEGGLFRNRTHTLGDIVSAEAVYVGRYMFEYGDGYPGQGVMRSDPTVYVAANDGMLHAVNAQNGEPRWSYIPSMVLPYLYRLADTNYVHRYLVDGTPVVGDVMSGGWKTILVGGLAGGGKGYYAIDISSQTSPQILWEMRKRPAAECASDPGPQLVDKVVWDCDLGYTFGNPVIAKVSGAWVVMVTSGYNNHTDGGDGKGYLYVLDATTGTPIKKISTGTGDTTTPSGLSKIAAWADNATTENIVQYVYGGDYQGNLWRFDVAGGSATLLKAFGSSQPITAKPELGLINGAGYDKPVVFVPTGSLIGTNDLNTSDQQSFYAIWDAGRNGLTPPSTIYQHDVSGHTAEECVSAFDDNAKLGWKVNFPEAKERGTTDPTLAFGTLVFSTNAPISTSVCNPSGFKSWVWNIDYKCGGFIPCDSTDGTCPPDGSVAIEYEGAATRPNVVVLPSGVVKSITRISGQELSNQVADVRIRSEGGNLRKISWRELFD